MARILVVDDDVLVRELVAAVLGDDGHEVVEAPEGAAALDELARRAADLVLLDLRMPGLDGWDFAARYAELPAPRAPLVLFTTAEDIAAQADALHADAYVEKPFPLDRLVGTVRHHLGCPGTPGARRPTPSAARRGR